MTDDEIFDQLQKLQDQHGRLIESLQTDYACDLKHQAKVRALISIVLDLAKREGLSEERFFEVLEKRQQIFHQMSLESTEDVSPTLAIRADKEVPSGGGLASDYPPLFPEDEKE